MNESLPNLKTTNTRLKKIVTVILILFIAIAVISFVATTTKKGNKNANQTASVAPAQNSTIIVYYFHRTSRCNTCIAIENLSREAIQNFFASELQSHKLKFISLNIELSENTHFVQDFNLAFNSLVLALVKDDKILKYKNLEAVWDYTEDKEKFTQYIRENIKLYLDEI